ncbi:CHAT domain-containing protein [Ilyonectria destructans]|nr:CHAT domain-containing protein [Ilyonectria destructans]
MKSLRENAQSCRCLNDILFQNSEEAFRLGDGYISSYLVEGDQKLLESGIQAYEGLDTLEASNLHNDAHHARRLRRLGTSRWLQHNATGREDYLKQALQYIQEAMEVVSSSDPEKWHILRQLATIHSAQYEKTGNGKFVAVAIGYLEDAMKLMGNYPWARAQLLNDHGMCLFHQSRHTGNPKDLEPALTKLEEAVSLASPDNEKQAEFLSNLSNIYSWRYEFLGSVYDLDLAIDKSREAAAKIDAQHPHRARLDFNLGNCYELRHTRLRNGKDLQEAVTAKQDALEKTPPSAIYRGTVLNGLAKLLVHKYRATGDRKDLDEAEEHINEAMSLGPANHFNQSDLLWGCGEVEFCRWEAEGDVTRLSSAIDLYTQLKNGQVEGDPSRALVLADLGVKHFRRATKRQHSDDAEVLKDFEAFKQLTREAVDCASSPPLVRAFAAQNAIQGIRSSQPELLKWGNELASAGLKLLSFACNRDLSRADQQHAIELTSGLAANGCALSILNGNYGEALQRVEYGRGLIIGHIMDRKDDLADLKREHPRRAQEFEGLRRTAFQGIKNANKGMWKTILQERREASSKLENLEKEIRQLPGFEQFQRLPSVPDLQRYASEGPIVIVNITDISSDAIIMTKGLLDRIHLPKMDSNVPKILQHALARHRSRGSILGTLSTTRTVGWACSESDEIDFLSWLWHNCVHLILDHLELSPNAGAPRVWWIGSGAASSLPFHAAGDYGDRLHKANEPNLPRTCLDYITPSYAPTLKALQHARRRAKKLNMNKKPSILFVAMPETLNHADLPGVKQEQHAVEEAVKGIFNFKSLEGPTAQEVIEELTHSQVVHFACHGSSDLSDPSKSHILLQKHISGKPEKDELTVGSVLEANSESQSQSWIVYLSACSTAEVKAQYLGDESLHLTSAFQVAGFVHAVGSLWSADDETCAKIARSFYKELVASADVGSNKVIPGALRQALMLVRDENPYQPSLWAPFIHYGA